MNRPRSHKLANGIGLLLLTFAALLVQGYHPFAEDAEIYLPGVEKILHPELFPSGQEFFRSHARLTLFPNLVAFSSRILHLPLNYGLFLWHAASIFLFLLACRELAGLCFPGLRARWGAVCLMAALLTLPVAGTALYVMDQYLNPRNLAAFATVFAVARTLEKKYLRGFLWIVAAALVHPMMWTFALAICGLLVFMDWLENDWLKNDWLKNDWPGNNRHAPVAAFATLLTVSLAPPSSVAYHEAAKHHGFHYIQHWQWYEQLGAVAPIFLFWWFARIARKRGLLNLERLSRAFAIYGLIFLVAALIVDLPARFEALARLQPLRSLHLLYIVMFIFIGGFLGEFVLKNRIWRWALVFVPLCAGMFFAQRSLFPASAHVEWPWAAPKNPWAQAFLWVKNNTPADAVFALNPEYMHIRGEDEIGFRCLAQRSRLADDVKDNGVVSMFPQLAGNWWAQVQAQTPWNTFQLQDFLRLKRAYGATWTVVQQPGVAGLDCPYKNSVVQVCRIP